MKTKWQSFWSKTASFISVFGGIVMPIVAYVLALTFEIADEGLDVMPTTLHHALVLSVPVISLILWICHVRGAGAGNRLLRVLCGFSAGVCAIYALAILPVMVIGLIVFVVGFWYFGLGFLGLAPSAPATGLAAALIFRSRLAARDREKGIEPTKGFGTGLLIAGLVWVFIFCDLGLAYFGCIQGLSPDPAVAARGVRLARLSTRNDIVFRFCRGYGGDFPFLPENLFLSRARNATADDRDLLYYRITGDDPAYIHQWGGRRRSFLRWDSITGGEKVGGILEDLSLKGSAYDTTVDKVAGIGYSEWTMTFGYASKWGQAEARCRIALPPGGVVSRLTLWINGEECEAAFGTKGQVRRAYEAVVSRRRDPVLVNVCGPDQVQLQCFPVPHEGEMKVRLGITFPIDIAADGGTARLQCPVITQRNFSVPADLLGLPAPETYAFEKPPAPVAVYADEGNAALDGAAVVQTLSQAPRWKPVRAAFVIDTSASMKPHMAAVLAALAKVPEGIDCEFWLTGDIAPEAPRKELPSSVGCRGGRPSILTLARALDSLAAQGGPAALVWIHGGEPVAGQSGDALALKLSKAANVRFVLCQATEGACQLIEPIPPSANIVSITGDAIQRGAGPALERLFEGWGGEGLAAVREKVASADVPEGAAAAGSHLGRLWAAEATSRTYRPGDPAALEAAQKLALPWHIVTPVTGAVVLETKEQYEQNDLEQVNHDTSDIPTTPEPGTILCLAVIMLAFVLALFLRRRIAA